MQMHRRRIHLFIATWATLTAVVIAWPTLRTGDAKVRPHSAYQLADRLSGKSVVAAVRQQRISPTVFVSLSSRGTGAATVFALHGQNRRIFCLVRNSALRPFPIHAMLLFQWTQGSLPPVFSFPANRVAGQFSYTYFIISTVGRYHCDVSVNDRPVGSVRFTITP